MRTDTRSHLARSAWKALALLALLPLFQGCSVPGWIKDVPVEKGAVYAVGHGDPGYWTNPMEEAKKRARVDIGRTVESEVKSVFILQDVGSQSYAEEVSATFSDTIVTGTRVLQTYYDEEGEIGPERRLYVLMKFEQSKFIRELAQTGTAVAKKQRQAVSPEQIEKAAGKAFEELDAALAQKNKTYEQAARRQRK